MNSLFLVLVAQGKSLNLIPWTCIETEFVRVGAIPEATHDAKIAPS